MLFIVIGIVFYFFKILCFDIKVFVLGFEIRNVMFNVNMCGKFKKRIFDINVCSL